MTLESIRFRLETRHYIQFVDIYYNCDDYKTRITLPHYTIYRFWDRVVRAIKIGEAFNGIDGLDRLIVSNKKVIITISTNGGKIYYISIDAFKFLPTAIAIRSALLLGNYKI